jgi:transposase
MRKVEMRELKQVVKKEEYAGLKGALWALRKRSEELGLEEKERLDLLFEYLPLLRKAYRLREKLTRIFDNKFLTTLEELMELITNYLISRSSSGWVEGLKNKIKALKRRSYGISNLLANLFRRLWLDLKAMKLSLTDRQDIGAFTAIPKEPQVITRRSLRVG